MSLSIAMLSPNIDRLGGTAAPLAPASPATVCRRCAD